MMKEKQQANSTLPEGEMAGEERPFLGMRAWAEARFQKPADEVTIADVEAVLPRNDGLPDPEPSFEDPKGGRVRYQLKPWPSPEDEQDLVQHAQHFIESTPTD